MSFYEEKRTREGSGKSSSVAERWVAARLFMWNEIAVLEQGARGCVAWGGMWRAFLCPSPVRTKRTLYTLPSKMPERPGPSNITCHFSPTGRSAAFYSNVASTAAVQQVRPDNQHLAYCSDRVRYLGRLCMGGMHGN